MCILMIRCTSGTTSSHNRFIFQSPRGILCRLQWMRSLLTPLSIQALSSFAATGFIDCLTILLDAITLHRCLVIPDYELLCRPSSLYQLLSNQQSSEFLLRATPSMLALICKGKDPLPIKLTIHLSGELLSVRLLQILQKGFPEAQLLNVYGGRMKNN